MSHRFLHRCVALAALGAIAGCAPAVPARQDAAPEQANAQTAGAPTTAPLLDPAAGKAGPLALGMTSQQAIDAYGQPETRYPNFLAWHGGKLTAHLQDDKIVALRVADPAFSFQGVHVGDGLDAAKHAFPQGAYQNGEVPVYQLPSGNYHAWLEVMPSVQGEILAVMLSQNAVAGD